MVLVGCRWLEVVLVAFGRFWGWKILIYHWFFKGCLGLEYIDFSLVFQGFEGGKGGRQKKKFPSSSPPGWHENKKL